MLNWGFWWQIVLLSVVVLLLYFVAQSIKYTYEMTMMKKAHDLEKLTIQHQWLVNNGFVTVTGTGPLQGQVFSPADLQTQGGRYPPIPQQRG
jgi:hypothetical protein